MALLVLAQYLNDDAIGAAWRAFRRGQEVPGSLLATAHVVVGCAILVLVAWRIALRLTRGAPPPPDDEPLILRAAAAATHVLLYAMLLLLPLSGIARLVRGRRAGDGRAPADGERCCCRSSGCTSAGRSTSASCWARTCWRG